MKVTIEIEDYIKDADDIEHNIKVLRGMMECHPFEDEYERQVLFNAVGILSEIRGDEGDFGPIQYIYKGLELPYVAKELGIREDIITQPPSDGLGVTEENTDEAQLGCDYKTFDTIMATFIRYTKARRNDKVKELMDEVKGNPLIDKIYNRLLATEFKRAGSVSLSRPQIGLV